MSEKKIPHGTELDTSPSAGPWQYDGAAAVALQALKKAVERANDSGARLSADSLEAMARDSLAIEAHTYTQAGIERSMAERNLLDRRFEAYLFQVKEMNEGIRQVAITLSRLQEETAKLNVPKPVPTLVDRARGLLSRWRQ